MLVREVPANTAPTGLFTTNEELLFQLIHGEEIIMVRAPDKKSKKIWMQKIESANDACLSLEKERHKSKGTFLR